MAQIPPHSVPVTSSKQKDMDKPLIQADEGGAEDAQTVALFEWGMCDFRGHRRIPSDTYSAGSTVSSAISGEPYMPGTPNLEPVDRTGLLLGEPCLLSDVMRFGDFELPTTETSPGKGKFSKPLPQSLQEQSESTDKLCLDITAPRIFQPIDPLGDAKLPFPFGVSIPNREDEVMNQTPSIKVENERKPVFPTFDSAKRGESEPSSPHEELHETTKQLEIHRDSEAQSQNPVDDMGLPVRTEFISLKTSQPTNEWQYTEFSDSEWWSEASSPDETASLSLSVLLPFAKDVATRLFNSFLIRGRDSGGRKKGHSRDSSQSSVASGSSATTTASTNSSLQSGSKGTARVSGISRKRPLDDEDEDQQPTQRRRMEFISQDDRVQVIACPFAKNNPLKHAKCFKYMIQEIARLKQHLLRVHQIPIHCVRCSKVFISEDERDRHLRDAATCVIQAPRVWDGVSEAQKRQLAKRVSCRKTKEENWYLIYDILFPESPRPDSPYVDNIQLSEELLALREFLLQEAPSRISAFSLSELPEELRASQTQVETFTQAAVRDVFDMAIERWISRELSQDTLSMNSTPDSGYRSRTTSSHSGTSSTSSGTQQQTMNATFPQGIGVDTEQAGKDFDLPIPANTLVNSESSNTLLLDSLDWFFEGDGSTFEFVQKNFM